MTSRAVIACSCPRCVNACLLKPCLPTPMEFVYLRARFPNRWVRDTSIAYDGEPIELWRPMAVGETAGETYAKGRGRCTFLRNDYLCELHDILKPSEGRLYDHTMSDDDANRMMIAVATTWRK